MGKGNTRRQERVVLGIHQAALTVSASCFNGGTNFCSTCVMFMGDGGSNAFPSSILCEVVNSQLLWKIETAEIH